MASEQYVEQYIESKGVRECQSDGNLEMGKVPITKQRIAEVMDSMRIKGAPASDKLKRDYCSRLGGLLKRGVLQVLDQPEAFDKMWKAQEWTPSNSLSYIKTVGQWIASLHQTGKWQEFYNGDLDDSALYVRQMSRHLNIQNK